MSTDTKIIDSLVEGEYKWGFVTEIDADAAPKGLNEDIIRLISTKKNEPEFMLEWRLKAFRHWLKAGRRGGGRGVRQRLRGHHVQGQARRDGHHLLLLLRGGAAPPGAGEEVPGLGGALHGQLLRRAQLGRLHRRLVRATSPRASAARWSCPPTSASTPRTPASSSAR